MRQKISGGRTGLHISLPQNLMEELENIAGQLNRSQSALVLDIVTQWLKARRPGDPVVFKFRIDDGEK